MQHALALMIALPVKHGLGGGGGGRKWLGVQRTRVWEGWVGAQKNRVRQGFWRWEAELTRTQETKTVQNAFATLHNILQLK